jgi:hypothetical protein
MALSLIDRQSKIAARNDALRRTFQGGRVMMTASVQALPESTVAHALSAMRAFTAFDASNDPHGEHDFGRFIVDGETFIFKIDYYDRSMEFGSDDSVDPAQMTRVLTLMLPSDY